MINDAQILVNYVFYDLLNSPPIHAIQAFPFRCICAKLSNISCSFVFNPAHNHHLSKTVVKIRACMRHKLKPCPLVLFSRIILTQSFILHHFMIKQLIHAISSLQNCYVLLEKRSGIICNVKLTYVIIKCALIFFAMNIRTLIFSKHTKKNFLHFASLSLPFKANEK